MASPRVLVVDDDSSMTDLCGRILEEMGCNVRLASGGREGLGLALQDRYDLVITDLRMSDCDGMEVVRRLAKERPDTTTIVMSGFGGVPSAVEATRLGATDFLEKPFTAEEFVQAVRTALSSREESPQRGGHAEEAKQLLRRTLREEDLRASTYHEGIRVLSGFGLTPQEDGDAPCRDISWVEAPGDAASKRKRR